MALLQSRLILFTGLVATIIASACAGTGNGSDDGSGASSGDGDGDGAGDGDLGDGLMNLATGGTGSGPDGLLDDPELTDCTVAADCCVEQDGCTDPSSYICTTEGFCGLVQGTCEDHGECQGDTYCCEGELCRGDGSNDGVCISAAIPPGLDCGLALAVGEFAPDVQCEWLKPQPFVAKLKELNEKRKSERKERAEKQRDELKKSLGQGEMRPAVAAELRHHAWRVARLNRLLELAQAADKAKAVERIEGLLEKENARHEKHLTHLKEGKDSEADKGKPDGNQGKSGEPHGKSEEAKAKAADKKEAK